MPLSPGGIPMALPLAKNAGLRFFHTAFFDCSVLMIISECRKCGARETVSRLNGSLQRWETQHDCGHMRPFIVRK